MGIFEEYIQLSASFDFTELKMVHASSEQCSKRLISNIVVVDVDIPHFAGELALLQRHHSGEVQIG